MAAPVVNSALDATAIQAVAFTYSITGTNTPLSYNATGLPTGLSVNTSTGDITGTTRSIGDFRVTISATNADGTGTATLLLRIELNSGDFSTNSLKSAWFAAQGYNSNDLASQISQYLASNGGGKSNDLNTQWYTFLSAKGLTGSTTDMYKAELIASVAATNSNMSLTDLERQFYGDLSNVFA